MNTLVLASASPQRSALLTQINLPYITIRPDIEESADRDNPEEFARAVARDKALAVLARIAENADFARRDAASDDALVYSRIHDSESIRILGADTLIDIDGEILGKPSDASDADHMIRRLSGRDHDVITAMTLITHRREDVQPMEIHESVRTSVRFARLSETEISRYIASRDWDGAAGAYRIQSLGAILVEAISGSYTNVVGLPLRCFYGMLLRSGFYAS